LKDVYLSRLSNCHYGLREEEEAIGGDGGEHGIVENGGGENDDLDFSMEVNGQQQQQRKSSNHLLHGGAVSSPAYMMSMDASAIQFQPTPTTAMPSGGGGGSSSSIGNGFSSVGRGLDRIEDRDSESGSSHIRSNTKLNKQQQDTTKTTIPAPTPTSLVIEQAFQNLHLKHSLSQSPEILTLAATRAYNSYNLPLALHHCQTLYSMDPLCADAALIQIATLTGLGQKRPLFRLAHALVDAGPKSAVAWYAVGCYYHACGRYDLAQRNFCRATRLDPRSAECWIAFGCAFASCDENDQANACFRAAQRFHAGSHIPMLYMGMEHLRTNNLTLAGHFLRGARGMGQRDPLCCNELGVWAYRKREWGVAVGWFVMALRLCVEADLAGRAWVEWDCDGGDEDGNLQVVGGGSRQQVMRRRRQIAPNLTDQDCIEICQEAFWEPTIFNLGQSYRKAKRFDDAILCFEKCLALCPGKDSSYSALGFTRHIRGDLEGAIEAYHQALSRKPDDPFASEMLNRALHDALDVLEPPASTSSEAMIGGSNNHLLDVGGGGGGGSVYHFGVASPSLSVGGGGEYTPTNTMNRTGMSSSMMSTSMSRSGYAVRGGNNSSNNNDDDDSDVDMSMT